MGKLPTAPYADGIMQHTNTAFGGLNHNPWAGSGELYDEQNISSDCYPLLAPRKKRFMLEGSERITGIAATQSGIVYTTKDGLYLDDHGKIATLPVRTANRSLIVMGFYIIIVPDMLIASLGSVDPNATPPSMDSSATKSATFTDGTLYGESATANTIHAIGTDWSNYFKPGDGVQITSTTNNISAIIREIDGANLCFDENIFTVTQTAENVTVERKAPILGGLFVHKNRLWGFNGSTVYASALGDPFNFNAFDGLSTDSWSADLPGGSSEIVAGVSYTYPTLLKADRIFRIYGDEPSQFQTSETIALGANRGESAVVVNNVLYYLSQAGVMAYAGGTPQIISRELNLGNRVFCAGSGTDGVKYYISLYWLAPQAERNGLYVYDPRFNLWHKENSYAQPFTDIVWRNNLGINQLWMLKGYKSEAQTGVIIYDTAEYEKDDSVETTVSSFAEFGDIVEDDPNKKGVTKLLMRVELAQGSSLTVKLKYNSAGSWETVATLNATEKKSFYLPIVPRRADHYRIRLEGVGDWLLYSITRESYSGSQI